MTRQQKIQNLLWLHFWLLIFEGALRKWFLPGLSTPLLIIRDPICLGALILGWQYIQHGPWFKWILSFWTVGATALALALVGGHGDLATGFYGARILFIYFPVIFLYAMVFSREDVWKFAKAILIIAIPMTILMGLQYSLPQSHFLNIAPGGEGSAGFGGALGKYRPPGTFSFINGLTDFYAMAAAFLLAWIVVGPRPLPRWLWVSAAGIIFALPLSISRTLLFNYIFAAIFAAAVSLLLGRMARNLALGLIILACLSFLISRSALFQDAQEAFSARWEHANWTEGEGEGVSGVLSKRVFGSLINSVKMSDEIPLFGMGIGLGTNVGAMRSVGQREFVVAEASWPAIVGELGPVLGFILIGLRVGLAIKMLSMAWVQLRLRNPLPFIVGSFALHAMLLGQTAQPTALGFLTLSCGLMLASCHESSDSFQETTFLDEEGHPVDAHV